MKAFDKVKEFVTEYDVEIVTAVFYTLGIAGVFYLTYKLGEVVGTYRGLAAGCKATENFVKAYEPEAYQRLCTLAEGLDKIQNAI